MILPDYLLDEEEIDVEEEEGNKVVSNLGLDEKIFNQAIRFILFIEMIFDFKFNFRIMVEHDRKLTGL